MALRQAQCTSTNYYIVHMDLLQCFKGIYNALNELILSNRVRWQKKEEGTAGDLEAMKALQKN